ncbi:MAG: TRAP transporter substrate-binding protein DctP [Acidobacteria bacterium]|nr:TRAP transporter substrate-binding protein DctP [Acidobacteriota bacterium]
MKAVRSFAVVSLLVLSTAVVAAQGLNVKVATFAPANSTWHKALMEMGATWARATEGRVKVTIYPGGTQGSEAITVKLMRPGVDQLQAALLMLPGLSEIDDSLDVFGIPFFFETDEELWHVVEKLSPVLEQRLEAKGFHVLNWGHGGWVQLFSKRQIRTLADLKQAKLFTTEGNDKMVQWYKSNGFQPVALSANDIPAQLKLRTGMIDAAPSPPYGALVLQFFRDAPYMLDIRVGPLLGATVITRNAWNKISEADRAKLLEAAAAMEKRLRVDVAQLDASSVAEMQKRGLQVTRVEGRDLAEFRSTAEKLAATMRGVMVPADIYDMALNERNAFRNARGPQRAFSSAVGCESGGPQRAFSNAVGCSRGAAH